MKKATRFILVSLIIFSLCVCTVFAVQPRWVNTARIAPNITQNNYYATVEGLSGTTKIACTLVLYQKGLFGSYSEVARTSNTYYGSVHTFSGSYTVTSGKTYKLEVTAVVTRNGTSETATSSVEKAL